MLVILQLRIRALYGRRSHVPAWVALAFSVEIVIMLFAYVRHTAHITCALIPLLFTPAVPPNQL